MIDAQGIREIIATYHEYGWILRRVLLSAALSEKLGKDKVTIFGDVAITDSAMDAAWFSRPPKSGGVAWEIRYLGDIPYALLEKADEKDPEFENVLRGVESRLRESIAEKETLTTAFRDSKLNPLT